MPRPRHLAAAALAILVLAAVAHHLWASPDVVLLVPRDGADWVRVDRPFEVRVFENVTSTAEFETTLVIPPGFAGDDLSVTALRSIAVTVDGVPIMVVGPADNWKIARTVRLFPTLTAGPHQLRLFATNPTGPALVRAACPALGLHTGDATWQAREPGGPWRPAIRAGDPWRPAMAEAYESTAPALLRCLPALFALFAAGAAAAWFRPGRPSADWGRRLRWTVLAAWGVLAIADLYRVPLTIGYDVLSHYAYVRYIAGHARLPPPDGGTQFFQTPLYYIVSAILWRGLTALGAAAGDLPYLIRLVPLACGAGLAELCYRTARHAFPRRPDLHAVAVVVGGGAPVNLYMSLLVGNEPMAACLGGSVALLGVRFLARPGDAANPRWQVAAGAVLGLAVMTKVSMGLWAVPLAAAVATAVARHAGPRRAAGAVAVVAATTALICVPHVVRTWRLVGAPVVSHTVLRGTTWWQDPGYRTPRQLLTFGRGLTRVAYGGIDSVADSLYSTVWGNGFLSGMADPHHASPWHWDLMACGLWFGLLPTAAIATGALAGRVRGGRWFPVLSIGLFVAALVWVYLTLPIYSCAKGSYLLSALPCAAVLTAAGLDRIMVGRRSRAAVVGLLACWGATSYLTYLVTG